MDGLARVSWAEATGNTSLSTLHMLLALFTPTHDAVHRWKKQKDAAVAGRSRHANCCRPSQLHNHISRRWPAAHQGLAVMYSHLCATDEDSGLCGLLNARHWVTDYYTGTLGSVRKQRPERLPKTLPYILFMSLCLLPASYHVELYAVMYHKACIQCFRCLFFFQVDMNNVRPIYHGS